MAVDFSKETETTNKFPDIFGKQKGDIMQ